MGITTTLVFAALLAAVFLIVRRRYDINPSLRHLQCSPSRKRWSKDIFFAMDAKLEMHSDLKSMKVNHDRYGSTYILDSLLADPVLHTIAPENLPAIHSNGKDFGIEPLRLSGMGFFCGKGFLTTDGETWQLARKLLKPSFAKRNISELGFLSRELNKLLEKVPTDGTTVDLQPLLFVTFMNGSLYFLLGIDPSEQSIHQPCTAEQYLESFQAAVLGTGLRIMLGQFKGLAPKAGYVAACKRAHEYIEHQIKQALQKKIQRDETLDSVEGSRVQQSMVQSLALQTDDLSFIRSQILQGMLATLETIATLVSNAMFLLARHPDEWARLRTEVLDRGEDLFTFQNLTSFKPLQNILNEALRLYPVFPMGGRTCLQDTTLPVGGGEDQDQPIFVPKGTFVLISYTALHLNEDVFGESPQSFRPARWDKIRPSQWEYMPFGGGLRACPGREKALVEAAYVVARLAQTFSRVESRDDKPYKEVVRLTAKNANGCKVGLFRT